MIDLHTIASEEQQLRGELRAVRSAIGNAETTLAAKRAEEERIVSRLGELRDAAAAVFERALSPAPEPEITSIAPLWSPDGELANGAAQF